jgi:hypothetical protein
MQNVQLYIYVDDAEGVPVAHRIELFNDEKISVTSSVQNFNDIGKLFTDYSQSFTIPASKHNNAIFRHWYESSVGDTNDINPQNVDNAFDHRIKYYGFIEINTIPFRDGKFTMQKANKKNGFIESYTINFVGNLVQLKDKFLEDKLNSLSDANDVSYYDELNFEYTGPNVIARVYDDGYTDVLFPLIGNNRRYEFNTATDSDIATATGAIDYRELFPAIPVTKILDYIQSAYELEFTGEFLNSQTFSKLYLFCKNTEEMQVRTELLQLNFTSLTGNPTTSSGEYNLTTNTLNVIRRRIYMGWFGSFITDYPDISRFSIQINTVSTNYNIHVYNNGIPFTSFLNQSGDTTFQFLSLGEFFTDVYNFTFFVNSDDAAVTFESRIVSSYIKFVSTGPSSASDIYSARHDAIGTWQTSTGFINIQNYIPDLKVSDFITALVKMFNIVIVPIAENSFEFLPLELWYQNGNEINITEFVEAENIEIDKPKLFKRIDFKHEKSENVLNNFYRSSNNNQEYGDLFFDNPNSAFTDNYEVKTPFEDIIWERYTNTTFLTATCWNKNLQAYTPKPVLLYDNGREFSKVGSTFTNIYWTDGVDDYTIDRYRRFSNEIQLAGSDLSYLQTLNWGVENSVWNLTFAPLGLYQQFYSQYILNLYNQRTRVVKAKAHFNTNLLTSINLNDRIILSNKRYLINTMNTDLTSGEVNLELINDFRDISQNTTYLRYSNIPQLIVDNTAQVVQYIIYRNNYDTFDVKLSTDFLSYAITTDNDTDILLNVTIPANATAADRNDIVILEYFKGGVGTIITLPVLQYA